MSHRKRTTSCVCDRLRSVPVATSWCCCCYRLPAFLAAYVCVRAEHDLYTDGWVGVVPCLLKQGSHATKSLRRWGNGRKMHVGVAAPLVSSWDNYCEWTGLSVLLSIIEAMKTWNQGLLGWHCCCCGDRLAGEESVKQCKLVAK